MRGWGVGGWWLEGKKLAIPSQTTLLALGNGMDAQPGACRARIQASGSPQRWGPPQPPCGGAWKG